MSSRLSFTFISLTLIVLVSAACGVRFSDPAATSTAMFQEMELSGDRVPGGTLTVTLTLKQNYPVAVRVACYYEESDALTKDQKKVGFEERATWVFDTLLAPRPGSRPVDADVPEETLSFQFTVAEEGRYTIACNSPASVENGMAESFRIRAR